MFDCLTSSHTKQDADGKACRRVRQTFLTVVLSSLLAACGGGGDNAPGYTVGGTISGLSGTGLVLYGLGNTLAVSGTSFTFANGVNNGTVYSVTVNTQPTKPSQTCVVENGAGTIASVNVTTVKVTCSTNTYSVSGTVSGLTGSGLVLTAYPGANLTIPAGNTGFRFPDVTSGSTYAVAVATQPANQSCSVANGSGTVTTADITNVTVTCTAASSVNVSGLAGSGLVLQNHATDDLAVAGNGNVTFRTADKSAKGYAVTVKSQPTTPSQTCIVANGTGTAGTAVGAGAAVTCTSKPGRFAYVAGGTHGIYCYAIDALSGALTNLAGDKACVLPGALSAYTGLAVGPSGQFLYATDGISGIGVYAINDATGALTYLSSATALHLPGSAVVDPTGAFLYVAQSNAPLFAAAINGAAGSLTAATGSASASAAVGLPTSLSVDSAGRFLYVAGGAGGLSGYSIDANSGALTAIAGSPFSSSPAAPAGVAIDPSGRFAYVTDSVSNNISAYAINAVTGTLTAVAGSSLAAGTTPAGVVVDPSGTFVYAIDAGANSVSAYRISSGTGLLSLIAGSPFAVGTNPSAITVHPSGHFLYVTNSGTGTVSAYAIDAATGALTSVSGSPFAASDDPNGSTPAIVIAN